MKRGAKSTQNNSIMPVTEIADRLGISVATVERDLAKAVRKIKRLGGFSIILANVQAVAAAHGPLQAGSVECRADWVERFGGMQA